MVFCANFKYGSYYKQIEMMTPTLKVLQIQEKIAQKGETRLDQVTKSKSVALQFEDAKKMILCANEYQITELYFRLSQDCAISSLL